MSVKPCVVAHGGAGSPASDSDACRKAAARGLAVLKKGGSALDAAEAATIVLEDDPRFNAGTGAVLRLDGRTIEMDASAMDSSGRIGAVAAIRRVKNPVRVARRVLETPHILLAGEGATAFAAAHGLSAENPPTPQALKRHADIRRVWAGKGERRPPWDPETLRAAWNFRASLEESLACDTVGAVARDKLGRFAACSSTGGASWMLLGRVGDSPLPGCGYWAGPAGAVTATGLGEEIARRLLCRAVYDWIAAGDSPEEACRKGVALYPKEIPIGLLAVDKTRRAYCANRDMAAACAE